MKIFLTLFSFVTLLSCSVQRAGTITASNQLRLLDSFIIPHHFQFQNTTVGGLSGIDYDPKSDRYFLICDDRSAINPARFYTARIDLKNSGIDTVRFETVHFLQTLAGTNFPDSKTDAAHAPDPEAIRYDRKRNLLVWSSEGERISTSAKTVLQDPGIYRMDLTGKFRDSLPLSSNMHVRYAGSGPRQNGSFEGMSFNKDFSKLYVSVEEPLMEDGPRAGTGDSSGWIRIIRYDLKTNMPTAQYAYQIDPVRYVPNPAGAFKVNGVPDILEVGKNKLLVMERSFSTGRRACSVRLYLADLSKASDVSGVPTLTSPGQWTPAARKLILDLDKLGIYTDNIEGACFGPRLPNGHQTLILVADDNFAAEEETQFFLFEIY